MRKTELALCFLFTLVLAACPSGGGRGGGPGGENGAGGNQSGGGSQSPAGKLAKASGQAPKGNSSPQTPGALSQNNPTPYTPTVSLEGLEPGAAHDGRPSTVVPESKDLNKSGEGGNSSFSFGVVGYRQGAAVPTPQCQATLTRKEEIDGEWACSVVTAAHCLADAEDVNNPEPPKSGFGVDVTGLDKRETKVVSLSAPDFGTIKARAYLHPSFIAEREIIGVDRNENGTKVKVSNYTNDVALLMFRGDACKNTPAKVVPMAKDCTAPMRVASRWLKTTFPAEVKRRGADRVEVSLTGEGIKQGDSGGALFCGEGEKETVVGVLSNGAETSEIKANGFSGSATYSANSAMAWAIEKEKTMLTKAMAGRLPKNESANKDVAKAPTPEPTATPSGAPESAHDERVAKNEGN